MAAKHTKFQQQTAAILAVLDIPAEYRELGLVLASDRPRASGKMEAYGIGRPPGNEDRKPSAWIDVHTGRYGDSSAEFGETLSLFDFAVKYGGGRYANWIEARRHYAKKAGVKISSAKPPENPTVALKFLPWDEGFDRLTWLWCHKRGISLDVLKAAGGRIAKYPGYFAKDKDGKPTTEYREGKYQVVALPAFGPKLLGDDPTAWVIWNLTGDTLPVFRGKGKPPDQVKMKSVGPTYGTLMNVHALSRIGQPTVEWVWKTAGPTDMLAVMSAIPPESRDAHLVTCNASSETGDVPDATAAAFAGCRVTVVHDADHAGEAGAIKWLAALAGVSTDVRQVRLPYEIQPKGGSDARDFLHRDGHPYGDLLALAEAAEPITAEKLAAGGRAAIEIQADTVTEESIVKSLGIDVLGEMEDSGAVKIFTDFHKKTHTIKNLPKLAIEELLQICGPPAKVIVYHGQDETPPGMARMADVKRAIGLLAGYRRIGDETEVGAGCWAAGDSVVLVGAGEAAKWNGAGTLEKIAHPRCGERLLELSGSEPWYDFDRLAEYLAAAADRDWCWTAVERTMEIFNRWTWKNQATSPTIVTGLALATWVQTLWAWRPQVAIIGGSNSGKSYLFQFLGQFFGRLAMPNAASSAAGLRQMLGNSAKIILYDEFDSTKFRGEILELLRAAGRGDKVARGTPSQKAKQFGLKHIAWAAGIESGLKKAPDANRFITLELVPPEAAGRRYGELQFPDLDESRDLGLRLLAVAVRHVAAAVPLAVRLKGAKQPGVDYRLVESYAVPAAILAAVQGSGDSGAEDMLSFLLADLLAAGPEKFSDTDDLIEAIFGAHVHDGKRTLTVAQMLEIVDRHESRWEETADALAKVGVAWATYTTADCERSKTVSRGDDCLVFAHGQIAEHLLKNTDWKNKSIDQVLARADGAIRSRRRVGGKNSRAVVIPKNVIDQYLGESETDEEREERKKMEQTNFVEEKF
jgi:hypothetical protein